MFIWVCKDDNLHGFVFERRASKAVSISVKAKVISIFCRQSGEEGGRCILHCIMLHCKGRFNLQQFHDLSPSALFGARTLANFYNLSSTLASQLLKLILDCKFTHCTDAQSMYQDVATSSYKI